MNCSDFEQQIALYVEEDLSAAECGRVEAHLRECSTCWDLAEDLKESQAVFKSIRQDIPNATALSALRERVLSRVRGLESMSWFERFLFGELRRRAALASVALVLVASSAMWWMGTPRFVRAPGGEDAAKVAPVIVVPPSVPEPQPQPAAVVPVRNSERRRAPAPVLASTEEPKQVAIQFVTDDPNVIIYWLVDEKGD